VHVYTTEHDYSGHTTTLVVDLSRWFATGLVQWGPAVVTTIDYPKQCHALYTGFTVLHLVAIKNLQAII